MKKYFLYINLNFEDNSFIEIRDDNDILISEQTKINLESSLYLKIDFDACYLNSITDQITRKYWIGNKIFKAYGDSKELSKIENFFRKKVDNSYYKNIHYSSFLYLKETLKLENEFLNNGFLNFIIYGNMIVCNVITNKNQRFNIVKPRYLHGHQDIKIVQAITSFYVNQIKKINKTHFRTEIYTFKFVKSADLYQELLNLFEFIFCYESIYKKVVVLNQDYDIHG